MRQIGLGIQSFEKIAAPGMFYVDKTDFIREWYEKKADITLITRPRRFGKTLTMDMLKCFFSMAYAGRKDLFEDLEIGKCSKIMALQGTFPVISVSFAGVRPRTFDEFLAAMTDTIAGVYEQFQDLTEAGGMSDSDRKLFEKISEKNQTVPDALKDRAEYIRFLGRLKNSIRWLSGWIETSFGKKVYILMDEYDTPLQESWLNGYYEKAIDVMRDVFANSLKENRSLDRAVITGISRIAKESLFSGLNNLAVSSILQGGYETVFGFTSREMKQILEVFGLQGREEEIRYWYDGFKVGRQDQIYNPWSVTNFLANADAALQAYWAQSGGMKLVDRLVRRGDPILHERIQELISGGRVTVRLSEEITFPDLDYDDTSVWSLLMATGYLKPADVFLTGNSEEKTEDDAEENAGDNENETLTESTYNSLFGQDPDNDLQGLEECMPVVLTNHEARVSLLLMGRRWFRKGSVDYMRAFADALLADDLEQMNLQMEQIVLLAVSSFDSGVKPSEGNVHPENFFHGLTTGLLFCLVGQYQLTSNREAGQGRYDLCLEPADRRKNPRACLLEFKVFSEAEGDRTLEDTARRARRQIDDRRYDADLMGKGFSEDLIRKYGFGFRGKEVLIVG